MTLTELQLKDERGYVQKSQVTGRYAVGVVPFFGEDVFLIKRKKEPFAGLYSIVTGHIELAPLLPEDIDPKRLEKAHMGERLSDQLRPERMIENPLITATREWYEELFPQKERLIKTFNAMYTGKLDKWAASKIAELRLKEEMDVIDTTTGYLLSVYSARAPEFPTNPESDVKLLKDISMEQINPLTQFVLFEMGCIKSTTSKINCAKVGQVKDLYVWTKRPRAFAIKY